MTESEALRSLVKHFVGSGALSPSRHGGVDLPAIASSIIADATIRVALHDSFVRFLELSPGGVADATRAFGEAFADELLPSHMGAPLLSTLYDVITMTIFKAFCTVDHSSLPVNAGMLAYVQRAGGRPQRCSVHRVLSDDALAPYYEVLIAKGSQPSSPTKWGAITPSRNPSSVDDDDDDDDNPLETGNGDNTDNGKKEAIIDVAELLYPQPSIGWLKTYEDIARAVQFGITCVCVYYTLVGNDGKDGDESTKRIDWNDVKAVTWTASVSNPSSLVTCTPVACAIWQESKHNVFGGLHTLLEQQHKQQQALDERSADRDDAMVRAMCDAYTFEVVDALSSAVQLHDVPKPVLEGWFTRLMDMLRRHALLTFETHVGVVPTDGLVSPWEVSLTTQMLATIGGSSKRGVRMRIPLLCADRFNVYWPDERCVSQTSDATTTTARQHSIGWLFMRTALWGITPAQALDSISKLFEVDGVDVDSLAMNIGWLCLAMPTANALHVLSSDLTIRAVAEPSRTTLLRRIGTQKDMRGRFTIDLLAAQYTGAVAMGGVVDGIAGDPHEGAAAATTSLFMEAVLQPYRVENLENRPARLLVSECVAVHVIGGLWNHAGWERRLYEVHRGIEGGAPYHGRFMSTTTDDGIIGRLRFREEVTNVVSAIDGLITNTAHERDTALVCSLSRGDRGPPVLIARWLVASEDVRRYEDEQGVVCLAPQLLGDSVARMQSQRVASTSSIISYLVLQTVEHVVNAFATMPDASTTPEPTPTERRAIENAADKAKLRLDKLDPQNEPVLPTNTLSEDGEVVVPPPMLPTPPSTVYGKRMARTAWTLGMLAIDIQSERASTFTYDADSERVLRCMERRVADGQADSMDTAIGQYVELFGGGVCAVSWRSG